MQIQILGSNSATPSHGRHHSAQVVSMHGQKILLDCGEGTQYRFNEFRIGFSHLNHIFISHLHGDHYLGLFGLLNSLGLGGRQELLHIFAPIGLKELIELHIKISAAHINFPIEYHELSEGKELTKICETNYFTVQTYLVEHRIPCYAFLIEEKPQKSKVKVEKLLNSGLPKHYWNQLQEGQTVEFQNQVYLATDYTEKPAPPKSYLYCTDTLPLARTAINAHKMNLLYHEATYTETYKEKAQETYHSTARQAATIAQNAQVDQLLIGHFSSRYKELDELLNEAQEIFPNTLLSLEGKTFTI